MKPEVSIIVPVYNIEPYIEGCIKSILSQDFRNFELILVNDGSIDHSLEICETYKKLDRRIKIINKTYGGVSAARNTGIEAAQGEFIGFVDGDDYITKNMFQNLYNLCKDTKSDIAICKLGREVDGKIINKDQVPFIKEMDNTEAMRELFKGVLYRFSLCNKLFKKKCFKNVQFPEGRIHEDLSTTYKLFANADKVIYTNDIGYIYVKRNNSILTSTYNEKRLDAFVGWREILDFMSKAYPQLSNEYISCFVFGCVDNFYFILNQVKNKSKKEIYINSLQYTVKNYYKQIMINESVSIKYKYLMTLMNYNLTGLLLLNKIKRFFQS